MSRLSGLVNRLKTCSMLTSRSQGYLFRQLDDDVVCDSGNDIQPCSTTNGSFFRLGSYSFSRSSVAVLNMSVLVRNNRRPSCVNMECHKARF